MNYQLQLHTEMSVQLQTELDTEVELPVRNALQKWLDPIFSDTAKDVDLRFFSEELDELRHQIKEEINDNRTSYTIYLPKENYMHLAVANIVSNPQVRLLGGEHAATMELYLQQQQEINSLNTGIFTARLPMHVNDSTTEFDVHLYMITAAVALVVDPGDCSDLVSLTGSMMGSADGFSIRDSIFTYSIPPRINMEDIININPPSASAGARTLMSRAEFPERLCMGVVSLPTEENQTWSVTMHATLTNNRHTKTVLTVKEPLKAGTLRILKCHIASNGGLEPSGTADVGASVELDWKEGTEIEIEI